MSNVCAYNRLFANDLLGESFGIARKITKYIVEDPAMNVVGCDVVYDDCHVEFSTLKIRDV
ncbi:hypothetical protein D3C80_1793480 [compost metagenome]